MLSFTTGDKKLNAAEAMSTAEVRAATGLTYRPSSNYFFCKGSLDIDNDPFFSIKVSSFFRVDNTLLQWQVSLKK